MSCDYREIMKRLSERCKEAFVSYEEKDDDPEVVSADPKIPECAIYLEILKLEQMTKIADRLDLIYKIIRTKR